MGRAGVLSRTLHLEPEDQVLTSVSPPLTHHAMSEPVSFGKRGKFLPERDAIGIKRSNEHEGAYIFICVNGKNPAK